MRKKEATRKGFASTWKGIRVQVLARMWRKGNPLALLVGMQTGAAIVDNGMEIPQEVEKITTLGASNCTTRYLPKEYKNTNSKGYMHLDVYSSIIYNSQIMETAQMPLG